MSARRGRLVRYRQVAGVLAKYGFGFLLEQGLERHLPFHGRWSFRRRAAPLMSDAQRLRCVLEELGSTFVKLGQMLSTRPDLLSPEFIRELSRLQDNVPPEDSSAIIGEVENELGRPISEAFTSFDPVPIGSASLGQVHAATLPTGEEVAVKVQRPGVEELVEEDIVIMMDLARLVSEQTEWGQVYDLPAIVVEFAEVLRGELNYTQEATNADRVRKAFASDPAIHVPRIHWELTTRRVLTMERLRGVRIGDLEALDRAGIDRTRLARAWSRCLVKMMLEDGFYHADPHPGNFLIEPDMTIGLVDYGIVGRLNMATRTALLLLLVAILDQDLDRVVDRLVELGMVGTTSQMGLLKRDLGHLLNQYCDLPVKEIDLGRIFREFMAITWRHHMQVPPELTLLGKTIPMQEGLVRTLDPNFNLTQVLGPQLQEQAAREHRPAEMMERVLPTLGDLGRLAVILPRRLDRLSAQAERGNLAMSVMIPEAERYLEQMNAMVNRLILAVLTTGFIVGIGVLMLVYRPAGSTLFVTALFGIGLVAASGLGTCVLVNMVRRTRR